MTSEKLVYESGEFKLSRMGADENLGEGFRVYKKFADDFGNLFWKPVYCILKGVDDHFDLIQDIVRKCGHD